LAWPLMLTLPGRALETMLSIKNIDIISMRH
jgi:hypothetical protein